jgi:hypothetical protein
MLQAVPNPFSDATEITLRASASADVRVDAYNVLGQRVRTLYTGYLRAGESHAVRFDGSGLPPGLYVIRAQAAGRVATQTVTLSS